VNLGKLEEEIEAEKELYVDAVKAPQNSDMKVTQPFVLHCRERESATVRLI
jgi:hypothetical protein